ncbi:hypothetical protein AAE478_008824 [Parahypoxylon ruwenzoriense]
MPPYRKAVTTICVLAPLFYIYWKKLTAPDSLGGFLAPVTGDVFNNTLGFSKILVINLPSRTDRRDGMARAGAVSNLTLDWIDGVSGDQVPDDIVPVSVRLSAGAKGSWRSHTNALRAVVEEKLGSALIVEDDIDWDIRLKSQLQTFASASRTWLRESKSGRRRIELPAFIRPSLLGNRASKIASIGELEGEPEVDIFEVLTLRGIDVKAQSVYGNGWDVLWLGHCGADFPDDRSRVSPLKVTILRDETVPAPKHLKAHPFALQDKLGQMYPPHTRVVHAASGNVCSLAYAVSYEGARKLLQEFDAKFDSQWDLMLQKWCDGGYIVKEKSRTGWNLGSGDDIDRRHRGSSPVCLTVQPPLLSHHYVKGGASNIQGQGGGYAKGTGTPYIRLSVQENLSRLEAGAPEAEMVDQLPDDGDTIWN